MMKRVVYCLAAVATLAMPLSARADAAADEIRALEEQLEAMRAQMREMQDRIDHLETTVATGASGTAGTAEATEATTAAPTANAAASQATPETVTAQGWTPAQPITLLGSGSNYLNISFDTVVDVGTSTTSDLKELELGDHDPDQRGFSLRNAEIALDGAVDPYFQGFANIVFKLDDLNETSVELEEAYALTTSLPWDLQVKAGQFLAEFGRQNTMHPHTWAFVDEPLVMGRLLGGEGLRNVGARVSWLLPTPFYGELLLGVFNGEGETAFSFRNPDNTFGREPVDRNISSLGDLLYVPRATASFDLSDTQTMVIGASGAFGPNDSGHGTDTQIYGGDLYWKWRPIRAQRGFPFVAWQSEAMFRRYEAGADATVAPPLSSEALHDWGFYSQVLWGFRTGWIAALRGEYVTGDSSPFDDVNPSERGDRTRVSPNLTWYPTEFSKLRLQYNFDHGDAFGDESSVWFQLEFLLGAHGAHKF